MPEYYLRHTVYTKVDALHTHDALEASEVIKQELVELFEGIGVELIDMDAQKNWEIVAQHRFQKGL